MTTDEWIQIAVAGVLTATLVLVLWYAWETRRQAKASVQMAMAMREQVLAADRPFLLIEVPGPESTEFAEVMSTLPTRATIQ